MNSLQTLLLTSAFTLLASCSTNPTVYVKPDGTGVVQMGGHLASKVGYEKLSYAGQFGTITVERQNLDATQVPKAMTTAWGMAALSADQLSATKATEGTTRALAKEETSRAATAGAQDVQKAALSRPLAEGLTPQNIPSVAR
jgi:hypothetical protein